jgi:nicotinamide mononucleotide transporter
MSVLEIFAVATTLACVWLTVRQNIWTWPLGLVAVTLYGIFFYQHRLYADMGLQVVYFAFNVYGWYEWLYGGEGHTRLKVSRVKPGVYVLLIIVGGAFAWWLGTTLAAHTNAAAPFFDSTLTAYSLVAQFMMTRKWIENWHVWIAVDIAYVYLFISRHLNLTAGLYAVFIILATMGLVEWRKSIEPPALVVEGAGSC